MRKYFALLTAFLISAHVLAAPPTYPVIPTMEIGGRIFTDLGTRLKVLVGMHAYNGKNLTLRAMNGTAGYQVTSGKTLRITALRVSVHTAETETYDRLCYADNDVGISTSTAFTNQVYNGGAAPAANLASMKTAGIIEIPVNFTVPSQKYPCMELTSSTNGISYVMAYGYEE